MRKPAISAPMWSSTMHVFYTGAFATARFRPVVAPGNGRIA
jgi:hypothetical protein